MKLNKLLIPLLGTMLGSAFVFMMKDEMSARLQNYILQLLRTEKSRDVYYASQHQSRSQSYIK